MQWKKKMAQEKHDHWQSKEYYKKGEEEVKNTEQDPYIIHWSELEEMQERSWVVEMVSGLQRMEPNHLMA